jgi:NADH-quinone oxidoreductase subunit E
VQVNYDMYGPVTDDEADRLLAGCREGTPPVSSWSGEAAPTFREVERELSGANDAFGDALVDAARHSIVGYDVPPSYKTGETDIPVTHPGGDRAGHGGEIFLTAFNATSSGNGDAPASTGDPEVAEAADDDELTPDQQADVDEVEAEAEDQAAGQDAPAQGDEAAELADDADQASDEPEADTTDQPAGETGEPATDPAAGDDDTTDGEA